jgi:hypothetical protein
VGVLASLEEVARVEGLSRTGSLGHPVYGHVASECFLAMGVAVGTDSLLNFGLGEAKSLPLWRPHSVGRFHGRKSSARRDGVPSSGGPRRPRVTAHAHRREIQKSSPDRTWPSEPSG